MSLIYSKKLSKTFDKFKRAFNIVARGGFEPSTPRVWTACSSQLSYLAILMGGGGFEPPKQLAADLQSVPFGHSGNHPQINARSGVRTLDTLIKSQVLCQLS